MKKTYITTMQDHIGAFLKGEWKVFGAHGAAKELHIAFSDD